MGPGLDQAGNAPSHEIFPISPPAARVDGSCCDSARVWEMRHDAFLGLVGHAAERTEAA